MRVKILATLAIPPILVFSPCGTLAPTAPDQPARTATRAVIMVIAPLSIRNSRMARYTRPGTSVVLQWSRRDTVLRWIWKLAASFGFSNVFEATVG